MPRQRNSVSDNSANETPRKFGSLKKHNYSYTKPSMFSKERGGAQWDPNRDIHVIPENEDAGVLASGNQVQSISVSNPDNAGSTTINANNLIINISNNEE